MSLGESCLVWMELLRDTSNGSFVVRKFEKRFICACMGLFGRTKGRPGMPALLLLLLPGCSALLQTPSTTSAVARNEPFSTTNGIVIVRAVPAGAASLADTSEATTAADYLTCKRMAQLAVQAFYGKHSHWDGPLSYMQRAILSQDVLEDVQNRLRYYEEARVRELRHRGAVFAALDESTSEIIGFADIGLTVYDTRKRTFRLPKHPAGDAGFGTDALSHLQCRPYLSNLAVDATQRRRGVGRLLVDACEAEVRRWVDEKGDDDMAAGSTAPFAMGILGDLTGSLGGSLGSSLGGSSSSRRDGSAMGGTNSVWLASQYDSVWLEVSLDNAPALSFYRAAGYLPHGETCGKEIVRRRWSFESEMKRRGMMCKGISSCVSL